METRANYVLIGLFTLAGIFMLIGGVIWLAKYQVDKSFAYYDIYFDDVSGLSRAGDVRYNGIPVGQVVDMELDKNQPGRVRVRIEVGADTPITEDTVAQLQSQGVTGVSYVSLSGGTADSQPLKPLGDAEFGAIKSERSALQDLFKSAPELLNKAIVLLEDVNEMVDDENKLAVKNILANLDQASGNLNESLASFNALSTELQKLAQTVVKMRERFGTVLGSADSALVTADQTLKTAQSAIARIDKLVESDVGPILKSINQGAARLDGLFDQVGSLASGATDTLASVKTTFDAAGGTLETVDETLGIAGETLTAATGTFKSAGTLIDESLPPLFENAARAASTVDEVAAQVVLIIDRDLAPITRTLRGAVDTIDEVITGIGESLPDLTANADTALRAVGEVFEQAKSTLGLLDGTLSVATQTLASAGETFGSVNRILDEDVNAIMADISSTVGNVNIAVAKVSGVLENQVPALANDLQAAAQRANSLMGNLDTIVVDNRQAISTFMRTGLTQFVRFIQEGRALIQTLERVAGKIDSDPARFLFGTQTPEYVPTNR